MSAIFGIFERDGRPVAESVIRNMCEILAHRGEHTGSYHVDQIGLGHRMLKTTPESLFEQLPFVDGTFGVAITADARIDNREELSLALDLKRPLSQISDSTLILYSYLKWGEECPAKLIGDFAFAIWNSNTRKLFCARDHIGAKSFYYYLTNSRFAFATEIKALLCVPGIARELNETRIADFLTQSVEDQTNTFYKNIFRLPAAHSLTVDKDRIHLNHYWALDSNRKLRLGSDEEYAEAFREIFEKAVRCRLRSAFPVGSTLSGGLDSSSVTCTARNILRERGIRIHTFSAIFPELPQQQLKKIDERKYIDAVLAQGNCQPYFLRADQLSPMTELEKVLWHGDEVYWGPNLYIHWGIYRAAQGRGVRVLLDGLDGDTTVSHGLAFLTELAWSGRWLRLINEARGLSKIGNSYTPRKIVWQFGFKPLVPEPAIRAWRTLRGRDYHNDRQQILNGKFAGRSDIAPRLKKLNKKRESAYTARRSHFNALNFALHPYVLELADKAGAAFSLEPRYPFYDRRLMEFCLALPGEQKLSDGWTRIVLRRAMKGVLPESIQFRRDKANLSSNFRVGLLVRDRDILERVDQCERVKKYIDTRCFEDTYKRAVANGSATDRDSMTLYGVAALSVWLQNANLPTDTAVS